MKSEEAESGTKGMVRKRDGRLVPFDMEKIETAIGKAFTATGVRDGDLARRLAREVESRLQATLARGTVGVEDIQDTVEKVLIHNGFDQVAKAYILYRRQRSEVREAKRLIGVADDLKLSVNAISVLEKRYLRKNESGRIVETPDQMFWRVAEALSLAEARYSRSLEEARLEFHDVMARLVFLPNSPTLMNAGLEMGQLAACFVLPVEDSIKGIFDAVKYMAEIHRSGGGTGFSFSKLRPAGDMVRSTQGVASGPVSFMRVFDTATDVVKQGGRRRGANMGILRVDHPDILEFLTAKTKEGFLTNFNVSVALTDEFMERLARDEEYDLKNPRDGAVVKRLKAKEVFDLIVTMAWKTGDPGAVFIDEINRHNPTPHVGAIESTNPCGEQPLLAYEACNLGSINVSKLVVDGGFDWDGLRRAVRTAVHFLDNVIDVNRYPLPEIEQITRGNRKIGAGVMGFADALIKMGIRYDSERALEIAESLMKFVSDAAIEASSDLAGYRGSFPNFGGSRWEEQGYSRMRNATLTTIAPTGTISIIAGCSSGIEPIFAVSFVRNVLEGTRLMEANPLFEAAARDRGFYSEGLLGEIARTGSVRDLKDVPKDVRDLFVTAHDIAPEWHVRMQAAFQKYVDNGVSKTVNLKPEATIEDVRRIYLLAYRLKCKGITVYRYGSKSEQVLYLGSSMVRATGEVQPYVSAQPEYSGGCPDPMCNLY